MVTLKISLVYVSGNLPRMTVDTKTLNAINIIDILKNAFKLTRYTEQCFFLRFWTKKKNLCGEFTGGYYSRDIF